MFLVTIRRTPVEKQCEIKELEVAELEEQVAPTGSCEAVVIGIGEELLYLYTVLHPRQ